MANLQSTAPIQKAESITPNDSNDIEITRGLIVAAAGNISVVFAGDTSPVTIAVSANLVYPFSVQQIRATGTTATGIIALR